MSTDGPTEFRRMPGRFHPPPPLAGELPDAGRLWLFRAPPMGREIDTRDLSRYLVVSSTGGWLAQDFATQDGEWVANEWRAGFFYGGGIYSDSGIDVYRAGRYSFTTKERHYPMRLMLEHVRRHPGANPPEVRIRAAGPRRIAAALEGVIGMPRRIVRLLTGPDDGEHLCHVLTGHHMPQNATERRLASLAHEARGAHWLRVAPPGWSDRGPEAPGLLRVDGLAPAEASPEVAGFPPERAPAPAPAPAAGPVAAR